MIAVTGGTGFIGHRLCLSLLREGHQVRVLARSAARAEALRQLGARIVVGDLTDDSALRRLVAGSRAVIHCAGAVRGRNLEDFHPVNVTATQRLLTAAGNNGATTRVMLLSSLAAREPALSDYANSKFLGEQAAFASASTAPFSIIRPPPVYGPGDRELLPLFRLMAKGVAVVPGNPTDRVSMLYVDDLVSAIIAWLDLDDVPRDIFTLSDGAEHGYTWRQIANIASVIFQRRVRLFAIPHLLLNGAARVNRGTSRLLGYAPMLTPGKVRELRHPDWYCDNLAFARICDWAPQVALAEGLALTMAGSAATQTTTGQTRHTTKRG